LTEHPDHPRERLRSDRRAAIEHVAEPTRAIVLEPELKSRPRGAEAGEGARKRPAPDRLVEVEGLARAINLDIAHSAIVPVARPQPATLLGKGAVEELAGIVKATESGLVIVDHALTPIQQRNLEKEWNAKVLDRTGLILEIFGERAHTKEGALQVELAHLNYQRGGWCAVGPTWNGSAAARVFSAAPAKRRSRLVPALETQVEKQSVFVWLKTYPRRPARGCGCP
jgi:hypothetical protein